MKTVITCSTDDGNGHWLAGELFSMALRGDEFKMVSVGVFEDAIGIKLSDGITSIESVKTLDGDRSHKYIIKRIGE